MNDQTPTTLNHALANFITPALPILADRLGISIGQTRLLSQTVIDIFVAKLQGDTGMFVFNDNHLDDTHKKHTLAKYQTFNQTPFTYHSLSALPVLSLHGFFSDNLNNDSLTKLIKYLSKHHFLPSQVIYDGLLILLSLCQYYLVYQVYTLNLSKDAYEAFVMNEQKSNHLSRELLEILTPTFIHPIRRSNSSSDYQTLISDNHQSNLPKLFIGHCPIKIQEKIAPKKTKKPIAIVATIGLLALTASVFAYMSAKKDPAKTPAITATTTSKQKPVIQDVAVIRTDKDDSDASKTDNKNHSNETIKQTNLVNNKTSDNKKSVDKKSTNQTAKKDSQTTKQSNKSSDNKKTQKSDNKKSESKKSDNKKSQNKTNQNKATKPSNNKPSNNKSSSNQSSNNKSSDNKKTNKKANDKSTKSN